MRTFILKHQDDEAAVLQLQEETGEIAKIKVLNDKLLPYLGRASERDIKKWWKMRGMPKSRPDLEEILRREHCGTAELFLMKNLGLSLTDTYWLCPAEMAGLSWEAVNLFDQHKGRIQFGQGAIKDEQGRAFTQNPNASLNASSVAYWRYHHGSWHLLKEDETHDGQQSVNEIFSAELHRRQGKFEYTAYQRFYDQEQDKTGSVCRAFTSKSRELVSAYEAANSVKKDNAVSEYEHYIQVCVSHGLSEPYVRDFMDYQTLTDFLITNTDRHYNNFGLLRDPDTMKIVSMAPIYDSGNSMFFRDPYKGTRSQLLNTRITGMASSEEKMLQFVKNALLLDLSAAPDGKETFEFYAERGIDEQKAGMIAHNYEIKRDMIYDLQKGKRLSVYVERQKERTAQVLARIKMAELPFSVRISENAPNVILLESEKNTDGDRVTIRIDTATGEALPYLNGVPAEKEALEGNPLAFSLYQKVEQAVSRRTSGLVRRLKDTVDLDDFER